MHSKRFFLATWVGCCAATALAAPAERGYARPELLAEAPQVAEWIAAPRPGLVVLDARPGGDYAAGHVPGAHPVDPELWKRIFRDGADPAAWGQRFGGLGIGADSTVVVYDRALTGSAARVWWVLRYWGVRDVRVLNGGWKAWTSGEGLPVSRGPAPPTSGAPFDARPHPERLATADEVRAAIGAPGVCLVDARSTAENRAGHIPRAEHLDWQDLVDPHTGRLLPAGALRAKLASAGFDPDRPTVAYCQSGGRSSVMSFAMEVVGGKQVANYFGSWGEWSTLPGVPIER